MSEEIPHVADAPQFEFEKGQAFQMAREDDPEEFWYVIARVWNYDAEDGGYYPVDVYHKQYLIGEVSTLGANPRLMSEADVVSNFAAVDRETAKEVLARD